MIAFLGRLDFYGSVIELLGLTVLLSYDVPFLQPQLLRVPSLWRRRELLLRLKKEHGSFDQSRHALYVPERALAIDAQDTAAFLALYPDWKRGQQAPRFVTLYAVHANPAHSGEPWIFLSNEEDEPVATALFLSTLFLQEEREIQKIVYSLGFSLMLVGGILCLSHIMGS